MGRGRDAADVAISTAFGVAKLAQFEVVTDELKPIGLAANVLFISPPCRDFAIGAARGRAYQCAIASETRHDPKEHPPRLQGRASGRAGPRNPGTPARLPANLGPGPARAQGGVQARHQACAEVRTPGRAPARPQARAARRGRCRAHLWISCRAGLAARAAPPVDPALCDDGGGGAAGGRDFGARRRDQDRHGRGRRRPPAARCSPSGRHGRGASARADRHLRASRHGAGAGARSGHRSPQCRCDPAHGGGLRGRRPDHDRAPFARIFRRARQIRLGRAGACADLHRHQSRPRAR